VKYAQLLNDASEVKTVEGAVSHGYTAETDRKTLTLQLPVRKPDAVVPVVELFLK
jgi:alpha-L-fucosidase